jgi:tubulin polyglutamylase TTLL5
LLIDGLKFDLRIYVALTSINPLRIYIYEEGLTRFATTPYESPENKFVNKKEGKFAHLTNYSINKFNTKGFIKPDEDLKGSKWSLSGFRRVLRANEIDDRILFAKIKDIIIKTFISVEPVMNSAFQMNVPFRTNCF